MKLKWLHASVMAFVMCGLPMLAQGTPPFQDFRVNTTVDGLQYWPAVGAQQAVGGQYVVAFNNRDHDTLTGEPRARLYDNNWDPIGNDFSISSAGMIALPPDNQMHTSADMDATGNFIVSWTSGPNYDVRIRRFNSSGVGLANDLTVATPGVRAWSNVDMADDGSKYVLSYNNGSTGVDYQVRSFADDAVLGTGTISMPTQWSNGCSHGRSAIADDGSFVITYFDVGSGYTTRTQRFQRYDSANNPIGAEVNVFPVLPSGGSAYTESYSAIGMNTTTGEFVIVGIDQSNWNGRNDDVYAQMFNADGTSKGGLITVTTDMGLQNMWPGVAMDDSGDFTAIFNMKTDATVGWELYARRFDSSGAPVDADPFLLNQSIHDSTQAYASLDLQPDGDGLIAWDDSSEPGDAGTGTAGFYSVWAVGIPEPGTLSLLAVGGLGLLRRRRRL